MDSIIIQMLSQHPSASQYDKKNSIKEVVQEILSSCCGKRAFDIWVSF